MSQTKQGPRFLFPLDGDVMVGPADGTVRAGGLQITARLQAPAGAAVRINGVPARWAGPGLLEAEVLLEGWYNRLEAVDQATGASQTVTVYVFWRAWKGYRFTVDDFIRSFQNIHAHRDTYRSIFEDPYLGVFEEAHRRYGSKVHINAFYATDDGAFNLSMMTDRFRPEFEANAHWLTFSFHALREHPDLPYAGAAYTAVRDDCLRTAAQLRRVVGSAALEDTTTLHWGAATLAGARALRAMGYRALCGYFTFCRGEPYYIGCYAPGQTIVSYYLTDEQVANLEHRCFWVDTREDIVFARLHLILNAGDLPAERVGPALDELSRRPGESGFIQMVIHEQHFYPDYVAYEPDYRERIMAMARWMEEHGYRPVSLSDILDERGPAV